MYERLYCIYDWKAQRVVNGAFLTLPSNGSAARVFVDVSANVKSEVAAHAEDYAMLFVGTYDPEKMEFGPAVNAFAPENIVIDGRDLEVIAARREALRSNG